MPRSAPLFLAPFVLLAVGCGGAMAGAPAPGRGAATKSADAPVDFATIDDAERALRHAESELALFGAAQRGERESQRDAAKGAPPPTGGAAPSTPAQAQPKAEAAPPAPPAADRRSQADDARPVDEERAPRQPSPCETACRALSSMGRAADAICRLAGDADPRCASARKRVEDSSARAATCRCQTPLRHAVSTKCETARARLRASAPLPCFALAKR